MSIMLPCFIWDCLPALELGKPYAQETKKGELTALWFLPIDAISFSQSLCVTSGIEGGLSLRK